MKKILLPVLAGILFFITAVSYAQPTFSSAVTTSTTNIRVTFTTGGNALTAVGAAATFTITGATITATAIANATAGTVDLTVNALPPNFSCTDCVALGAGAATNSAGASIAATATGKNVSDGVAPTFTATAPAASSIRNNTTVSFTLSENLGSGSITWTRTGGTADPGSPWVQALAGTELNSGTNTNITLTNNPALVSGAVYTVSFNGVDLAGNAATTLSNTTVTFDNTPPTFTATAPAANSFRNNTKVSYTLSENIASGSITWTRTGGTADPGSPWVQALAGAELNSGTKTNITLTNNPTLVDGAIYTVTFDGTDLAGNTATTVTNTSVTFDNTAPTFTATAPAASSFQNNTTVSYTLSENIAFGSITWTRTGGTADPGSPWVQALAGTELNSGTNTNITLTNNPALVSGAVYTVSFNGVDLAGNAATTVSNTTVTFDNTPPTFTATAPAANSFRNNTKVSYTLSENIASGSITWTRTGGTADPGSPRVQVLTGLELNNGVKTNITLTNSPTLVDGTVYTVTFNGIDAAGNAATPVSNANFTFDTTPPAAPSTVSVVTTGGFVRTNYWNGSNTGVDLGIDIPNDASLVNGIVTIEARVSTGVFATIASSSSATIAAANTTKTMSITAANIIAIAGYSQGSILQFRARLTDVAGNGPSGNTQSGTALTVDTVQPTLSTSTYNANGGSRETMVLTFSETLDQTSGIPVLASPGFTVNQGAIRTSGSTAFTPSGITLQSNSDGQWTTALNVTYTKSSNLTGNYVRDLAGNELASITFPPGAFAAPVLASSMVLNPNGAAPETIVFTLDQTLNTSTAPGAVTGLTVNGTSFGGTYSTVGNTVTLTSVSNGQWGGNALVSYSGGNMAGSTGAAVASFTNEPILIGAINLASNNANASSVAKVGDIVTLSFTANAALSATPIVTIGGLSATVGGTHPNYSATITTTGALPPGAISFAIQADEASSRSTIITNSIPGSTVTFDQINPVINPISIASNNPNTSFARIGDVVSVSFTSSEALFGTPVVTIGGQTASVSNIGLNYTASVTIDNSYSTGNLGFSISLQDLAGNVATANATTNATAVIVDKTPPVVASIVSSSSVKGFGTQAIAASSINFLVTFTEANLPLTGIDPTDFTVLKDASISYSSPVVVTGSGATRTVTINNIAGTGRISLGLTDDNTILDAASNPLAGAADGSLPAAYSGTQYYTIVLPEPSASVTNFVPSSNTNSVTVTWNDAVAPATQATHYLVRIKKQTAAFAVPTLIDNTNDGVDYTDTDFTDGTLASYVAYEAVLPTGTITFNGLSSGTVYNVEIYPLTYTANYPSPSSGNWDYRFTSPLTGNATTTTSASGTISLVSSATTISSVATALSGASAPQVNATQNFVFTIKDDGTTPGVDDADFKFSTIVIKEGTGSVNSISDWTQAIASAELSDGVNTPVSVTTSAVTTSPNTITFNVNSSTVGFVADNTSKNYTLRIALKTALGGTLPSNIDGKNFEFRVDQGSFATFYDNASNNKASSTLAPVSLESGDANNQVAVIASQLLYNTPGSVATPTQPQSQIGVGIKFSLSSSSQPVVYALDPNNNLDLGFAQTGTIDTPSTNLNPSPTSATFSGGQLSLSNVQLNAAGTSTIRVQASGVTAATSTNVTAVISSRTTITAGAATEPAAISSLATALSGAIFPQQNAIQNFDFVITDDLAANNSTFIDNDALPTLLTQLSINQGTGNDPILVDWTKVIAGAELRTSGVLVGSSVSINATSISFSGIANSISTDPGYIADGGSRTFQLRVFLRTSVDATIADDIDNKDFVFSLDQSTVSIGSANTTSTLATSTTDSGNGNNTITVLPTRFAFTTAAYNSTGIGQSYDSPLSPLPIVKVQDPNGNRDINYAGSPTVAAANPSVYTLANTTLVNSSGTINFNAAFQVTSAGNGSSGSSTTFTVSDGTLTSAVSVPITFSYSGSSDIIRQTVGFSYTSDILYATAANQVTTVTNTTGTEIERFNLRDGAGATDADGTPTVLTAIKLNIANWQYLKSLALFDGATKLAQLDVPSNVVTSGANAGDIAFTGFTFTVPDNSTKDLSVKASFNALNVVDNQLITVRVVSVKAANTASSQFSNTTPSGIQSAPTNQENQIEVVATVIDFTTLPANASVYVPVGISAEARDGNSNRDLDYNGTITSFSTTPGAPAFVTTNDPSGVFANGMYTFPANFQFTTGNATTTITLASGAATTASSVNATAISSATTAYNASISVITSFESRLADDPTYISQPDISYIDYQATNITNSGTSYEVARFLVRDGDPTKTIRDADGASTILQDFDVELFTGASKLPIRSIAIYVAGSEVAELAPAALIGGKSTTSFNGVNITAPDEQDIAASIRVSFLDNATDILDNDPITIRISSATNGNGSNFIRGLIGGVNGGLQIPATTASGAIANRIEVNATRLDFTTQPANLIAGINQPFSPIEVSARDAFNIVDLDYDKNSPNANYQAALLSSPAGLSLTSYQFTKGVLTLPVATANPLAGLYFTGTGDGTITVTANGLSSDTGGSIPCLPIRVMNVEVTINNTGIVPSNNIKGGTENVVLFGITFNPKNNSTSEPSLKKFSFTFDFPFKNDKETILQNIRVKDSKAEDVTLQGATVTTESSKNNGNLDRITVDWSSSSTVKTQLFDSNDGTPVARSYFLVCNVSPTARSTTQKLTPLFVAGGYGSASANNLVATQGSASIVKDPKNPASDSIKGKTYQFASTKPPTLFTTKASGTYPYNAQLNVDPYLRNPNLSRSLEAYRNKGTISLKFDVKVWSRDGNIELFDRATDTKVADLTAINGNRLKDNTATTADTIVFEIDPTKLPLKKDGLYYVKIAKGTSANGINTGISDDAENFFGGISYNGSLYFKVSSPNPPKLLDIQPLFSNSTTGSFSVKFDQQGIGYFLVLDPTLYTSSPSNADIQKPTLKYPSAAIIASDSFNISQVNNNQFVSFASSLQTNKRYDIWVFAKSNSLPLAQATRAPYGDKGNNYAVDSTGTKGPTLAIITPRTSTPVYQPTYLVCPNSSTLLTEPIIITENTPKDFSLKGVTQEFNLLLPAGFEFIQDPKIRLNGSDFVQSSLTISRKNNTLVNVKYRTNDSTSLDNIIISDLYLASSSSNVDKNIIRFAGNAKLPNPNQDVLAKISISSLGDPLFKNSFSKNNDFTAFGFDPSDIITAIPNNYADVDQSINGFIRLFPVIKDPTDYGPNVFSGTAITNDLLSLSSAPLNAPFDITITHTDLNGCVSTKSSQYLVYDNNFPIKKELGLDVNKVPIGTKQALTNPNFPNGSAPGLIQKLPDANYPILKIADLTGYSLIQLYANLPSKSGGQILKDSVGYSWSDVVKKLVVAVDSVPAFIFTKNGKSIQEYFRSFQWDYSKITNAKVGLKNTFDIFKKGNYWTGGSLGKVQFTARYRSNADPTLFVPLRQEVELFVAPVPIIEFPKPPVDVAAPADVPVYCENGVTAVGASPLTFNGFPAALAGTSVGSFSLENASDGLIFCAKNLQVTTTSGGTNVGGNTQVTLTKPVNLKVSDIVSVFGYTSTAASINTSAFVLAVSSDFKTITLSYNFSASNTITHVAVSISLNGFVDNGNGTAALTPDIVRKALNDPKNNPTNSGYQNIKLGYTFRENASPVSGTGYITIRIAPNPKVTFKATSLPSINVLASKNDAYCENKPVEFESVPDIIPVPGVTNSVDKFTWDFGDPIKSGSGGINANSLTDQVRGTVLAGNIGVAEKPQHVYTAFAPYTITHTVTSNYGCQSKPYSKDITVGAVPTVEFNFRGVSTGSDFYFKLTNAATATSKNDGINQLTWDFGDGHTTSITTAFTDSVKYNYSRAGLYNASLKLTSTIGCINTLVPQQLLVLPLVIGTKKFDFETDQQWFDYSAGASGSSWARGKPVASSTTPALPLKPDNGEGVWKTSLSGAYTSGERSYLFSPTFDISMVAKPLVSFDSYYDFNPNAQDAVVLQFSTDSYNIVDIKNKKWYTLGTYDGVTPSGYNWYNAQGLASKPGSQTVGDYGWTGQSKGWKDSRHTLSYPIIVALDNAGKPIYVSPEKSKQLVFRFALASSDGVTVKGNGFAIDNFTVGERTRYVLVESFSNLGNPSADEKKESDLLKSLTDISNPKGAFNKSDILNINYHVGFPNKDPFNLDNPDDPSARALFYNISTSPRSRLDGFNGLKDSPNVDATTGASADPLFSTWQNKFLLQQLKLADALIDLTGTKSNPDGSISIPVKVTSLKANGLSADSTLLHVGVLEKSIKFSDLKPAQLAAAPVEVNKAQVNSEFVLKKMLPSAAGTKFTSVLAKGDSKDFGPFTWSPDPVKLYPASNDLYAFAFIQNAKTGEVYQAAVMAVGNDPSVVTGLEALSAEDVSVFPNPASKEFTVELPSVTTQKVNYQVFDQMGREVNVGAIGEGQRSTKISTDDFSSGIYIIQLTGGAEKVIRKKVMVVKE